MEPLGWEQATKSARREVTTVTALCGGGQHDIVALLKFFVGYTLGTQEEVIPRMQIEARHSELVQLVVHRALGSIVIFALVAEHWSHYVLVNVV